MFKTVGGVSAIVFVILAFQLGEVSSVGTSMILSLLFVMSGAVALATLQFPQSLKKGKLQSLLGCADFDLKRFAQTIEELALTIRRDGMLVAEAYRKNLKDQQLQYLVKRSMEGFEKAKIYQWIKSHDDFDEALFQQLQTYLDRAVLSVPVVGLIGSLLCLMQQPIVLAHAFTPFLVALVLQLVGHAVLQRRLDSARQNSRLYYAVLAEGMNGVMEGVTAEFLKEQLHARLGISPGHTP